MMNHAHECEEKTLINAMYFCSALSFYPLQERGKREELHRPTFPSAFKLLPLAEDVSFTFNRVGQVRERRAHVVRLRKSLRIRCRDERLA